MHERRPSSKKIYPTYRPYPLSLQSDDAPYSPGDSPASQKPSRDGNGRPDSQRFSLITDHTPSEEWPAPKPIASNDERGFRPLRLLNSLFADRLDFLRRAMSELEEARQDREQFTRKALDELDSEILECEHSLPLRQLDPDRRQQLERRLDALRRDRRKEKLLSWRDIVWLRGEIRKLQREVDALGRTASPAENREPPT